MLTITKRLPVDPGGIPVIVHLSQYDSDFTLVFELFSISDFTIPSGTTAEIRGTKSDGNGYSADATVDAGAKTVTVAGDNQITAASGKNVFEIALLKDGELLNTANFTVCVERAALDADTIQSETVLKDLDAIIEGAATATEAAREAAASAAAAAESASTLTIDPTLTRSGQPADAKVTGDEISDLKSDLSELDEKIDNVSGLSDEAKIALLTCFQKVAWIDTHGQDYYDDLYEALYPDTGLVRITAVFTQGSAVIYPDTPINDLKAYLTVTGYYRDGTSKHISDYSLSGTLTTGTSVITVLKEGKTATFNVIVAQPEYDHTVFYKASDGVILTEFADMEVTGSGKGDISETLTNNTLRVRETGSTNYVMVRLKTDQYVPANVSKIKATARVKIADASFAEDVSGFYLTVKSGDKAGNIFTRKTSESSAMWAIKTSAEQTENKAALVFGDWYDIEIINENGTQIVSVNGNVIHQGTGNTYANSSGVIFQKTADGTLDMYIDYLKFEWADA